MWIVWQKNSISFYDTTGYWLYLARVKASICFDGVYLNVPGEYCWIESQATCIRQRAGGRRSD